MRMTEKKTERKLNIGIRLIMFLVCFAASLMLMTGVKAYSVFADDAVTIQSPEDGKEYETGNKVTIKARGVYTRPEGQSILALNYLYFRVSRDGKTILYESGSYRTTKSLEKSFTPDTEGYYLIEVCRDMTYGSQGHVDLAEKDFVAEKSITIKVRKNISGAVVAEVTGQTTYTGQPLSPAIKLQLGDKILDPATDYSVSYSNNVNAGTGQMTITGQGMYTGTLDSTFQISGMPLPEGCVGHIPDTVYPGKFNNATPKPVVTVNGIELVEDTDYEVSYENNRNVGTASVIVTGKNNYASSVTAHFQITKASIRNATISEIKDKKYKGEPIRNVLSISYGGYGLYEYTGSGTYEDKDYTAVFENNINPGTATITITGINNFKDTVTRTFTILEPSASTGALGAEILSPKANTSYPAGSEITVKADSGIYQERYITGLAVGVNYIFIKVTRNGERVLYTDGVECPLLPIKSTGQEVSVSFTAQEAGEYLIEAEWDPFSNVTQTSGGFTYTPVSYDNFKADDSIKVYVGVDNPSGIKDISSADVSGIKDKGYTGSSVTQNPTVKVDGKKLEKDTDYYLTYSNNIKIGEATITIHGKGKYTGKTSRKFQITAQDLSKASISLSPSSFTYNGSLQKPEVTVSSDGTNLVEGVDYTLENAGGTEPGNYKVTITAADGSYCTGSASKSYSIGKIPIDSAVVKAGTPSYVYDGSAKKPSVSVTLNGKTVPADVYTVSYTDNTNAGTKAKVTVTAKGESYYKGSASGNFTITAHDIAASDVTVGSISALTYNRSAQTPVPEISFGGKALRKDTDFSLQYANNTNAGTASVTISGKGNFKGSRTAKFTIGKKDIADESITVAAIPKQMYTEGSACTPAVTVKDSSAALGKNEVQVSYQNNDRPGTASVTLTGTGNYTGSRTGISFEILKKSDYEAQSQSDKDQEGGDGNKTGDNKTSDNKTEDNKTGDNQTGDNKTGDNKTGDDKKTSQSPGDSSGDGHKDQQKSGSETGQSQKDGSAPSSGSSVSSAYPASQPALAAVEKAILGSKTDSDPKGSDFATLTLRSPKQGKTLIQLKWSKVKDATEYVIYANKCGKANRIEKIATVKAPETSFRHKNLKKGTYYKYVVVAVRKTSEGDKAAGTSRMIHVATKGGKVGNAKSVKLKIKKGKKKKAVKKAVTLKKGKKIKLTATARAASKKKIKKHTAIRYESTNPAVATISTKGVIKAKEAGTCEIYAYAQNGVYRKFKLTVK